MAKSSDMDLSALYEALAFLLPREPELVRETLAAADAYVESLKRLQALSHRVRTAAIQAGY